MVTLESKKKDYEIIYQSVMYARRSLVPTYLIAMSSS